MIISNSSPLMYLSKINKLDLLRTLFSKVIIPKQVYEEVVIKGKENKFLDYIKIENAINNNWVIIEESRIDKEIEKFISEIDLGEISVISLAKKLKPELILIDDASARTIAESLGFNVKGTIYILLKAYKNKILNKEEMKSLLRNLISEGFRISPEFYAEILDEIENVN